jgi:hypothetical protein
LNLLLVSTVLVVQNELSLPKITFLKVPKCDIFDHPGFHEFYTIKTTERGEGGDFGVLVKFFYFLLGFIKGAKFLAHMLGLFLRRIFF